MTRPERSNIGGKPTHANEKALPSRVEWVPNPKGGMKGFRGIGGRAARPSPRRPYGFFLDLHPQVSHMLGTSLWACGGALINLLERGARQPPPGRGRRTGRSARLRSGSPTSRR